MPRPDQLVPWKTGVERFASITKPITAAAVMMLVEDGRIAPGDPVDRWLPELAEPKVVRTPASPADDVVPAPRPITVFDLVSSQAGYGFASDFTLPAVQRLFSVQKRRPGAAELPRTGCVDGRACPASTALPAGRGVAV